VVADDDGVTVAPRARAVEALEASRARAAKEAANRTRFAAGELSLDLNGLRAVLEGLGVAYVTQREFEAGDG